MRHALFASLLLFTLSGHAAERAIDKEVIVPAPIDADVAGEVFTNG